MDNKQGKTTIVIATMHQKEKAIGPVFEEALDAHIITPGEIDTDNFGSFSGEYKRKETVIDTLRKKCQLASAYTQCQVIIASEGSFGPHPKLGIIPVGEEYLMWRDIQKGHEVVTKSMSTDTNYGQMQIHTHQELTEFAEKHLFPSHALILSHTPEDYSHMIKGISDLKSLNHAFEKLKSSHPQLDQGLWVQTDMRAMHNPTRMAHIAELSKSLLKKIQTPCPACHAPGFDIVDLETGLPCELCNFPTQRPLKAIKGCIACDYQETSEYPGQPKLAPAGECNICNP